MICVLVSFLDNYVANVISVIGNFGNILSNPIMSQVAKLKCKWLNFNTLLFHFLQEHKCVLDSCRALESEGFDVTYLPVMKNGLIDLQVL